MAATIRNLRRCSRYKRIRLLWRREIQKLAYELYCLCGYEHGHDLEHWAEAERRVLERVEGRSSDEDRAWRSWVAGRRWELSPLL